MDYVTNFVIQINFESTDEEEVEVDSSDSDADSTFHTASTSKRPPTSKKLNSSKPKTLHSPSKSKSKSKTVKPVKPPSQSLSQSHSRRKSSASYSSSTPATSSSHLHGNSAGNSAELAAFAALTGNESDDNTGGKRSSRRNKRGVVPGPMWDWYKKTPSNSNVKKADGKVSSNEHSESPSRELADQSQDDRPIGDGTQADPHHDGDHTPMAMDSNVVEEDVKPDIDALRMDLDTEPPIGQAQNSLAGLPQSIASEPAPKPTTDVVSSAHRNPTVDPTDPLSSTSTAGTTVADQRMVEEPPHLPSPNPLPEPLAPATPIEKYANDTVVQPSADGGLDVLARFATILSSDAPGQGDIIETIKTEENDDIQGDNNVPMQSGDSKELVASPAEDATVNPDDQAEEDDQKEQQNQDEEDAEEEQDADDGEPPLREGEDGGDEEQDEEEDGEEKNAVGAGIDADEDQDADADEQDPEVDLEVEVDTAGADDGELEADPAEAEMETETEIQPTKRAEALDILAAMELKFATLRERIFIDKMEEIAREEAMILDGKFSLYCFSCLIMNCISFIGTHPEHLYLLAELQRRRDRRLQLATLKRDREEEFCHYKRATEDHSVWSWWKENQNDLRDDLAREASSKRRKLEREKRSIDHPKSSKCSIVSMVDWCSSRD